MKLEYGKRYIRRDCMITGALQRTDNARWPFLDPDTDNLYADEGRVLMFGESPADLVAEYTEPTLDRVIPYGESPSDPDLPTQNSRRYEIALACLPALIIAGSSANVIVRPSSAIKEALTYADLFIEALKEPS